MKTKQGENRTKQPEPGKSKGSMVLWIALSVVLVTAVALLFLITSKNLFGGRDHMLEWLASKDETYLMVEAREQDVTLLEQELEQRETELREETARLEELETELDRKVKEANRMASRLAGLSESSRGQLQWLGIVYSGMEPEQAAGSIESLGEVSDMAVVLHYMEQEPLIRVMNCLEPGLAAEITEYMLD